jgi:hypothetical protein
MEPKNTQALNIISGLVTPFLIETLFVVWLKESRDVHPPVAMGQELREKLGVFLTT